MVHGQFVVWAYDANYSAFGVGSSVARKERSALRDNTLSQSP